MNDKAQMTNEFQGSNEKRAFGREEGTISAGYSAAE
jgi:hypothetical protein